ncbi:hypothetical protein OUZ56_004632 [Daphnia magna]|uniref:Secreted protein n=1 Tax=Daphnia magna TaxID=35525 RepID=A0ABQ9YQD6_9CRUS|nr:hypothetical protein OUZ56_004632 [Daphnia magna]
MKQRCFVRLSRCRTTANYKQHPCTMMVPVVITAMLSLLYSRVPTRVKYYPGCFLNHWHSRLAGHNTWPPHHPYTATFGRAERNGKTKDTRVKK